MLYRSTDRLCRSGAPMENLCHSASFESDEKNAPSKSGTKHLAAQRILERLGGIDIEKGAMALDRDFRHRFAVPEDQVARADIAVERHQLLEKPPRPQDRIAAPAVADGHRDQTAA